MIHILIITCINLCHCLFSNIHSEKKPYETNKTSTTELLLQGEASSESGVCNLDEEDSGSELNFADNQDSNENNGESSDYFEPDDESTIDEQETFEALNNEVVTNQENEIHVLEQVRNLNFYKFYRKKLTYFNTVFH